jgi:2-hydroxychromene-2-carboxylate isomerase
MTLEVDLFWSFRSPYSYLATPRLATLAREFDVDIRVRPVLPLAVRVDDFFDKVNPLWPPYLLTDIVRVAEYQQMPLGWPRPDPVVQDFATREVAQEQPYIHRLTRLGVHASELGRGMDFIEQVAPVIWDGTVDGWNTGDHMARAAGRAGLDLVAMDAAIEADPSRHDGIIEENQRALQAAGHWGVPTMAFKGEPFFGQDRIDLLRWRLEQNGLRPRTAQSTG